MASAEIWISWEEDKGILLSETEENGIVTRTYIAPLTEPKKVENSDTLALPKNYPMPFFCPHCGNGIGSSGAFSMHLRACQRRLGGVDHKKFLPAKLIPQPATRQHLKLEKSVPDFKHWSKSFPVPFQCIFCRKEFKVQFEHGQERRRYACDDCGQRARAEEAERQKNPKVKKKTLTCDRCGKQYKLEGFLMRHQVVCQGFCLKRKREYSYTIHEVPKKKCGEKSEVTEVQLKDEIQNVLAVKEEDEIQKVAEVKAEDEAQKVLEVKQEDEIPKATEVKTEDEIYKCTEAYLEGEKREVTKIKSENECREDS